MSTSSSTHSDVSVRVTDLTIRRGHTLVFDALNVSIRRGEITGLLGPSGCGKTTLMRAIVGAVALCERPAACPGARRPAEVVGQKFSKSRRN